MSGGVVIRCRAMSQRSLAVLLAVTFAAAGARAQTMPVAASDKPSSAAAPRKDPKGITGLSPFWERLSKGDSALVARDFEGAIAAYREAISQSPQNPLGHYRMGQAQLLKGDLKEAEIAYTSALRFASSDPTLKAKALFCLADLNERQKANDDAILRWLDYEAHAKVQEKAKTYPASAAERKKRNEEWKKIASDSAEVKTRIERRLKEAEESVRKSSK